MKARFDITYLGLLASSLVIGILTTVCMVYRGIAQVISVVLACALLIGTGLRFRRVQRKIKTAALLLLFVIIGYLLCCLFIYMFVGNVEVREVVPQSKREDIAVILVSPGEIKGFDPGSAVYRLKVCRETGAYRVRWWNIPYRVWGLKKDISNIGESHSEINQSLFNKLQQHLDDTYTVYNANLYGWPYIETVVSQALRDGFSRLIVLNNFIIEQPYKETINNRVMKVMEQNRLQGEISYTYPLWNHNDLVSMYEKRIVEKTQESLPEDIGIVLVARGYERTFSDKYREAVKREKVFLDKICESLMKNGYDSRKIRTAYLRYKEPGLKESIEYLLDTGVRKIVIAAAGFESPCIDTEYVIPRILSDYKMHDDIERIYIGSWADDDCLVEALAERLEMATKKREQD
jgi:protoheme ferro-lyase